MALEPRYVSALFRPLLDELLGLLARLSDHEWQRATVAGAWRVRDVVAHLIDGDLRKIAVYRDGHVLPIAESIQSEADLGRFVNQLNAGGVAWAARLSPRLLLELAAVTGRWVCEVIEHLPPHGESIFPVSWAGESRSENWMDIGREYTERWHHQQQIRNAVSAPLLIEPRWMDPLLDFSVRALPHAFRDVAGAESDSLLLVVDGREETTWSLVREPDGWDIHPGAVDAPTTRVAMVGDTAWRVFYNALPPEAALARCKVEGAPRLAEALVRSRSVIL